MAASASFEEFYTATVDRLHGHLFLVTGDLHAAEELVQEAFTRAATRWSHSWTGSGSQLTTGWSPGRTGSYLCGSSGRRRSANCG